jgi:hypothetical protein
VTKTTNTEYGKSIWVDEGAYKILMEERSELVKSGINRPSFGDCIRAMKKKQK